MNLRKINSIISLITTTLLLIHSISLALWMLSKGAIPQVPTFLSIALIPTTILHAVVSIIIMIITNKGSKESKGRKYKKMHVPTILQRITGVLLIIFTWLHVAGTVGIMQPPQIIHAIVPPIFFLTVMIHVSISASKAFITLGIGNAKFVKIFDISIKAFCAITLIADIIGFYLFVC